MKEDNQNEKFDHLMRGLVREAQNAGHKADEFADAPEIWWAIRKEIEAGKAERTKGWLPTETFRRLVYIGAPAIATVLLITGLFVYLKINRPNKSESGQDVATTDQISEPADKALPSKRFEQPGPPASTTRAHPRSEPAAPLKSASRRLEMHLATTVAAKRNVRKTDSTPVKTDFIPLTYARNADSGQIVRVRVPSSMMVSLGLVNSVEKPNDLVDADVVVGDDGLTRAIRFSR